MKQIENRVTKIPNGKTETGEDKFLTYADLVIAVTNQPKQGGFDMNDISMRLAIRKACEKANGEIEIEDLRMSYLKGIAKTSKWYAVHEDLEEFLDYIDTLK